MSREFGKTWVTDLDGVVWLAEVPIPGSAEAIDELRATGRRVLFVTNNSAPTVAELISRLGRAGIGAEVEDLITSAQAAADMLEPGSKAVICADEGVVEALGKRGGVLFRSGQPPRASRAALRE